MEEVVIVGAGPAGLFAANELAESCDVTIVDEKNVVGGSGLVSDGKLNFHPQIGGDLTEFFPEKKPDEAWRLVDYIDQIFRRYGVPDEVYQEDKLRALETKAAKVGIKFIPIRQKHIGSDRLPNIMESFKLDLESRGIKFKLGTKAMDLQTKESLITNVKTDKGNVPCDHVLMAPGRSGSQWIEEIGEKLHLEREFNPIDVGIRVEVLAKVMEDITNINWDPKFHIRTKKYDDFVRTFCCSPYGYVTVEDYGNSLFGVNGHSMHSKRSENTNFAFLVRVGLTEPLENTTEYGRSMVHQANILGGGKPLIQRLGDLETGRRSTWSRIERSYVKPTLRNVTPGELGYALNYRIVTDIVEGLKILNNVVPGVYEDHTLLYAPEVKFYAMRIKTSMSLQTMIPNLFVAGDGAGVSRGIVGAAATGIIAARGILASR